MKVSHQQSKRVKCLSCLFMVNDGFDSSPKEQWETRSEGCAFGWPGGGKCRGFEIMHAVPLVGWKFSSGMCVHVLREAAESLWSVESELCVSPPSHLCTHPCGPAGGCRGILALWPRRPFITILPLFLCTHTPDWGQFS